ncbi:DUF4252 domain-containing protein [Puia dinghuensis]|uniref:DUF4252 domain-containing protein n=1 Tax=Puia dinghuensis TaxID=1792502 RepID=A0A8J2UCV3_9BACT|nr:DUF4252 domain-containing protein [Puia dinghuensis]GGA98910.1 hypothetical protein GCM10011511_22800 [Puia dinghuensis]
MKKIAFILFLLLTATGVFAQDDAIGRFFGKYLDDSRFSVVSVSPRMFRLMSKIDWDTIPSDLKQTISRLQSFRVLSTPTTPALFYKEALTHIDRKEYEDLITVRNSNDNFHFMIRATGNTIHELLMIAADEDGFTLMSFVGDIDLDKLSRLATDMDIKGMENLKNAKRK